MSSSAIKSPAQFDAPSVVLARDARRRQGSEELVKAAKVARFKNKAETDPARRYLRATAPPQISQLQGHRCG